MLKALTIHQLVGKFPIMGKLRQVHKRFTEWMSWAGLSQEAAGKILRCRQTTVSHILKGNGVSIDTAARIESATSSWPSGPITISEWASDGVPSHDHTDH